MKMLLADVYETSIAFLLLVIVALPTVAVLASFGRAGRLAGQVDIEGEPTHTDTARRRVG